MKISIWQIVHNWNFHATCTVECISICGNIHFTPQKHAPHNRLSVMCNICGYNSGAAEYSSLLGCYTVSLDVMFLTFQCIMVPLSSVTLCNEIVLLTHWHIQTSLRRPGSLGPLIHSRLWDAIQRPTQHHSTTGAQQGYVLKSIKINFASIKYKCIKLPFLPKN